MHIRVGKQRWSARAVLVWLVASCGAVVGCGAGDTGRSLAWDLIPAPETAILVLDPMGRVFDSRGEPRVYVVPRRGRAYLLSDGNIAWANLDAPDAGAVHSRRGGHPAYRPVIEKYELPARILVLANGCKPALVPLERGLNIVHLEAGDPLRVQFGGGIADKVQARGFRFSSAMTTRFRRVLGVLLPSEVALRTRPIDTFETDRRVAGWLHPIPPSGSVEVLVPLAGEYTTIVEVSGASGSFAKEQDDLVVATPAGSTEMTLPFDPEPLLEEYRRIVGGAK